MPGTGDGQQDQEEELFLMRKSFWLVAALLGMGVVALGVVLPVRLLQVRSFAEPFAAGLRRLQTALENDAGAVRNESTRELIRSTIQSGRQAEQNLAAVRSELDKMTALLTPSDAPSKH